MRTLSLAWQNHLNSDVTTTCKLLQIRLVNGDVYGMAEHDQNIVYNGVTYYAINGFDHSNIATNASYDVDNSEGYALLAADIPGITLEMARAGALEDATWKMFLINWADLSIGHIVLDAGDIGEVTVTDSAIFAPELLSYVTRLRQSIGHVDSLKCRAIFGTNANSQTGCGVNESTMWQPGSVDSIGVESKRVFVDTGLIGSTDFYPGRLIWSSGDNTSTKKYQIETFDQSTGAVGLFEPLPFEISIGDQFTIRRDCDKSPASCKAYNNFVNYKGEPHIPVADGLAASTPGAQT